MPLPAVIAIDGPAGSGKSTISYHLAERYGYLFIDTGVYYRTVTLLALRAKTPFGNVEALKELTHNAQIEIVPVPDNRQQPYRVFTDGEEVTDAIRSREVEASVSTISAFAEVREELVLKQREAARKGYVIMAGRDIGTVVLPDADLKLYIDASIEERARRRLQQSQGEQKDLPAIQAAIRQRDAIDSEREVSPLRQAPDAHYINTDNKTIEAVVNEIGEKLSTWQQG